MGETPRRMKWNGTAVVIAEGELLRQDVTRVSWPSGLELKFLSSGG